MIKGVKPMNENNNILKIFTNKLSQFLGKDNIEGFNNLYNGLFYYITCCVNYDGSIGEQYDLCIVFLTILKNSIDTVVFSKDLLES